jgi:hypothetical protein
MLLSRQQELESYVDSSNDKVRQRVCLALTLVPRLNKMGLFIALGS